ncbi:uncharacterized protein [Pocillopora verrucosa]|uniref:uncharacterized protein isoform X2 n=1 Tax=Pocillopora verrucosa TaxID=203993 RepID=UPI00333F210E
MMLLFACGLVMLATAASRETISRETPEGELVVKAMSFIIPNTQPPSGVVTKVAGIVRMMQPKSGGETTMIVNLLNLPPNTPHGFHIHEFGDTFSQGCQSTGSHYNPFNMTHGGPLDKKRGVLCPGKIFCDSSENR